MNHADGFLPNGSSGYRKIFVNSPQLSKFPENSISTTKYGFFTFVPLFLFEQFHNYTNCFFLLVSIIQQFPEASTLGRYTTVIPLCIILSISAVKEILEDFQRYRADREVNKKTVETFKNFQWTRTVWKDVQVGDLVKVYNNEPLPADLLFLQGSSETGLCYIETMNLDGENNLKIRHHVPGLSQETEAADLRGMVECEPPNERIYSFNGLLHSNGSKICLTTNHILLRGATLRNTKWIIGLVIYTGNETKIMKNSSSTRMKRSSVSVLVNSQIIVLFALFVMFTVLHWIFFMIWNNNNYAQHWYLSIERQDLIDTKTIIICLVFGVIYSIIIPISLQVMQDLSRVIQGMFICNDLDMYYEKMDVPALVKTSGLNEDLALVKYIFADKTGTLTQNILEFKCCSISGTAYTEADMRRVEKTRRGDDNSIYNFFIAVCLCPGVVPVKSENTMAYYTSSPDQKALLQAAQEFGYQLLRRSYKLAEVCVHGKVEIFEVLCEFEFSSDRKRSSVIVKNPNNELVLYTMGADEVILPRLHAENKYREVTVKHIDEFASKGLRSLCVAMTKINKKIFDTWYPLYKEVKEALTAQEMLVNKAEAGMVRNLTLLGATAVEDKLQDEVPETILSLLEAGINIWMLTGDKQETAVNIGYACKLLSAEMPLIVLNVENIEKLRYLIVYNKRIMGNNFGKPGNEYGLIVTGACLNILLDSKQDLEDLFQLMLSCQSVICCRTTPKQKALIVKHIQKRTQYVTLAIGDGANDVAMIQTASIGIGISGMEGLQAANAADYSIAQFKYLKKLLLVHGTWSYNRICKMIYFIYYKNVLIATIQFCYTATAAWSGMLFFDRWARMLYNVMLTGAPTLALGIFEQSLPAETLMNNPYTYTKNRWFNMRTFAFCLLNAFIHALFLSWLSFGVFDSSVYWGSGKTDNVMFVGNIVYTILITIVCLKSGLHTIHWTNLTFVFLIGSEIFWFLLLLGLSYCWLWLPIGEDMPGLIYLIFISPSFWLYLFLTIVAVLGVDYALVILFRICREPLLNVLRNAARSNRSRLGSFL